MGTTDYTDGTDKKLFYQGNPCYPWSKRGNRKVAQWQYWVMQGRLGMPYSLFHTRFPEVAESETRTVTVIDPSSFNLPPAHYSFLEMFCDESGCDCRRVFLSVVSSLQNDIKAVIAWGWEDKTFYRKWMGSNDPNMINDLMGPVLNLASPQSDLSPALLKLFQRVLLQDSAYIERVKQHYAMFRETVDKRGPKKVTRKKKRKKKKA